MSFSKTHYNLSAFRLFFCTYLALSYLILMPYVRVASENVRVVVSPVWASVLGFRLVSVTVAELLAWLLISLLILAGLGWGRRLTLIAVAVVFTLFEYPLSSAIKPYTTNINFFVLWILCLSDSTTAYTARELLRPGSKSDAPEDRWTVPLLMSLLPLVYLNTCVSKIVNGGWGWISGQTVQAVLFERYLYTGNTFALAASQSLAICFLITMMTLVGETIFMSVVFSKTARKLFVPMAFTFHVIIYYVMQINFILTFCSIFFIYIDYSWIYAKWIKWGPQKYTPAPLPL